MEFVMFAMAVNIFTVICTTVILLAVKKNKTLLEEIKEELKKTKKNKK